MCQRGPPSTGPGRVQAQAAHHRIVFGEGDKRHLIAISTKLALAWLGALAVAMTGAVLVTGVLFDGALVVVTTALVAALFASLWFGLGTARSLSKAEDDPR